MAEALKMTEQKKTEEKQNATGYPSVDRPWLKYYSEEALNTPLPQCSIYQFFYQSNKDSREAPALDYFGKTITYGEVLQGIQRAEAGLRGFGVKEGDIVSAIAVSTPEIIYLFYALNKMGAVSNWIDPRKGIEEVKRNITMTDSKLCMVQDIFLERLGEELFTVPEVSFVMISLKDSLPLPLKLLMSCKKQHYPKSGKLIRYADFIREGDVQRLDEAAYRKDAPALLEYTGGTTGKPKAVMLSNENCNAVVVQYQICGASVHSSHSWLSVAFPFTAYSLICSQHLPLSLGMKCTLCFELELSKVESLLLKRKCNHIANTPIMWENVITSERSRKADYSFLITPTVGADTISIASEQRVNEFLQGHGCKYKLAKGYGMTEAASGVTLTTTNEINKLGSVGIPFRYMVIGIFDLETGEELSYNEQGEICISGPSVMLGYYHEENATADILKRHKDGRMWLHSGDLGHMDSDGFLFIEGRLKRMIIDHVGFKIFAPNVEAVISQVPGVEKCCVVGARDRQYKVGQLAVAYVKTNIPWEDVKERITVACQKFLPEYSRPAKICRIEEFPYTATGKVDYRVLEKMAEEA